MNMFILFQGSLARYFARFVRPVFFAGFGGSWERSKRGKRCSDVFAETPCFGEAIPLG